MYLGLVHNYVPVVEEDSGKRCVVDGFPESNTMRFMGPYTHPEVGSITQDVQRCAIAICNGSIFLSAANSSVELLNETTLYGSILLYNLSHASCFKKS